MPELIERGHLYIAQPPLYKIKRGKKELYLKDELALQEYLLNESIDGASLKLGENGKMLRGKQIIPTLRNIIEFQELFAKMVHKGVNEEVLKIFVEGKVQNGFADMTDLTPLAQKLGAVEPQASFEVFSEPARILFTLGNVRARIDQAVLENLSSHEYEVLLQAYEEIEHICRDDAVTVSIEGKEDQQLRSREEVLSFFLDRAKKGQYIQRYKGLGEMNPEQLWETTMDPDKRTMLQVKIEDAVEADEIFTVLMGDQVEPRRDFIERNALNVSNLDV